MTEQVSWPGEIPDDEIDLRCKEWQLLGLRIHSKPGRKIVFGLTRSGGVTICKRGYTFSIEKAVWLLEIYEGNHSQLGCSAGEGVISSNCPFGADVLEVCYKYDP